MTRKRTYVEQKTNLICKLPLIKAEPNEVFNNIISYSLEIFLNVHLDGSIYLIGVGGMAD